MVVETTALTLHILSASVALGAVAVTDFLHLRSMKNHRLEVKLLPVYPYLTQLIYLAVAGLLVTGITVLYFRPHLLSGAFFHLKMALFAIVMINGVILGKKIGPMLESTIKKNLATKKFLIQSSLLGSISVTTWIAIFVLALTKNTGYTVPQFITAHIAFFLVVFFASYVMQSKSYPH